MAFQLDYIYGNETASFRFYRVPKALFHEDISLEAVTLYGLMLDRVDLSVRNGWVDAQGRVYIYFVQTEVQKHLRCGHNRATAFVRELEAFGLIERKRQGLGKPARIYVKNLAASEEAEKAGLEDSREATMERSTEPAFSFAQKEAVQTAPNGQSGAPGTGSPDCPKQAANDTDKKETESSETNPILSLAVAGSAALASPQAAKLAHSAAPALPTANASLVCGGDPRKAKSPVRMDEMRWVREEIRENIDYEGLLLVHPGDREIVDGYIELMTEAACSSRETVRVCGQDLPTPAVRSRFLKLERDHIEYVRDCLRNTTSAIGNIKAYTLAALYNAPATMEQYYDALVSRDFDAPETVKII